MKGFTVFEILVAILIFSFVAMGLSSAVVIGKSALMVSDTPTQLRQNVLFAIMALSRDLRQADLSTVDLKVGESSNSITFQIPRYNNIINKGTRDLGQAIKYECKWCSDTVSGQLTRTSGGKTLVIVPNIVLPLVAPPSEPIFLFSRKSLTWSLKGVDNVKSLIKIDINARKAGAQKIYYDREQAIVKMRN